MDTPTPCPECTNIVDLDDMVHHPNDFKTLVCEECEERIEEENNSGHEMDDYGNKLTWKATPDDGLIEMFVNGETVTEWVYEDDPEFSFNSFMRIWKKAQKYAVA